MIKRKKEFISMFFVDLLITDELFRNIDFTKRRRYVQLVDSVKESGGEVRLFSR